MNREEAINVIKGARKYLTVGNPIWNVKKVDEAFDMAIEALSSANLKEEFESAEYEDYEHATLVDIKEPLKVLVVRCKDCRHKVVTKDGEYNEEDIVCDYWLSDGLDSNDFCSYGERKE